jgi:hypothetical protein
LVYLQYVAFDDSEDSLYEKLFTDLYNAIPIRLLDLDKNGCLCLIHNLETTLLSANRANLLKYIPQYIQNTFSDFISNTLIPIQDNNNYENIDDSWQKSIKTISSFKFYNDYSTEDYILALKTLYVLPNTNLTFYAYASIADELKKTLNPTLWENAQFLLQYFWSKHHSLEHLVNLMNQKIPNDQNMLGKFAALLGKISCVENQKYQIFASVPNVNDDLDKFEFSFDCMDHNCSRDLDCKYVFKAWERLISNSLVERETENLLMNSLESILAHNPQLSDFSNLAIQRIILRLFEFNDLTK